MASSVEHADISFVVYPVHMDGTRTGAKPRLRHYPDCGHFDWGDGVRLGIPERATPAQMRNLKACKTCIARRGSSTGEIHRVFHENRTGKVCPSCDELLPLSGVCDNCGD